MRKTNSSFSKIYKLICLALAMLMIFLLASCSSSTDGKASVGKVGEYDVPYEELYFLASSYRTGLDAKYGEYEKLDGEAAEKYKDELRSLVCDNIVANYAILSFCAEYGLTVDSEGLDERVEKYIESTIKNDFNGSKREYKKNLKQYGLTDSYVRFTARVDLLYLDLMTKLVENGVIASDEETVKQSIKENFARTWHIMISNDKGESVEDNRKKAQEALSKQRDGSMSMYKLIGSAYNEDYSITDLDGLYFARGSMDEKYEEVAFSLEVGEVSEVFETSGTNSRGERVSAFYIVQRLAIDDAYIEANYESLEEKYRNSVIYEMLKQIKEKLSFVPSSETSALDLTSLKAPK